MPNNKSAEKRVRQTLTRTTRNKAVKSQIKTAIRRFEDTLAENVPAAEAPLHQALRTLDRAASKGVIHKNKAARNKSRLVKRYQRAQ